MVQVPPRITEVLELLPGFQAGALKYLPGWENSYVLSGTFRPFHALGISGVAGLLAANLPLFLTRDGEINTYEPLPPSPDLPGLEHVTDHETRVELWVKDDGSHPDFYLISPRFDAAKYAKHPHPSNSFRPVQSELRTQSSCIYLPTDVDWSPTQGALIVPLTWAATWVAAHLIWEKTGVWLTTAVEHDYRKLWAKFGHTNRTCICGSSKLFRECCTPDVVAQRHNMNMRRPA